MGVGWHHILTSYHREWLLLSICICSEIESHCSLRFSHQVSLSTRVYDVITIMSLPTVTGKGGFEYPVMSSYAVMMIVSSLIRASCETGVTRMH